MIWVAMAVMLAAALALVLTPVLRTRRAGAADRAAYDLTVYRAQLAELEADVTRGTVSAAEAVEARLEIERRMLRAAPAPAAAPGSAGSRWIAPAVAMAVPLLAVGLYLLVGHPDLPAQPAAGRDVAAAAAGGGDNPEFVRMADRLAAKLAEQPDNPEDWRLLGRTYMELGRYAEAANAFRQGMRLKADDTDLPAMLGEALVLNAEGQVTPAAAAAFEATLKAEPRHPIARYYLALGRLQAGATREAFDRWLELAKESDPAAPWMRILPARLEELAKQLKIDLAAAWPRKDQPPIAGTKGPTPEQMRAAADMAPEDRQQFIRSMVERLAGRLKENPNDLEGWTRLARAYRVLGDNDKAAEAEARVAALQKPPPAAAAPGPTAEQAQAAQQMAPQDREQMIRGMVQRLADRLKDNPDDVEGWTRLGRSYAVLGERQKSLDAYARAAALKPNDPAVLANHAQAIAEAADPKAPIPADSVRLFQEVLKMDALNPQALWVVGLADAQSGDRKGALEKWRRLLGRLPPDSPEFNQLQRRITELEKQS